MDKILRVFPKDFLEFTDEIQRDSYIQALYPLKENELLLLLNRQFRANKANLEELLAYLEKNKDRYKPQAPYFQILHLAKRVLNTPLLHAKRYQELSPDEQIQFLLGLLNLDFRQRTIILKQQEIIEPNIIAKLLEDLTEHLPETLELFKCFATYLDLIHQMQTTLITDEKEHALIKSLIESADTLFNDKVISYDEIKWPYLVKEGTTYDYFMIKKQIDINQKDPRTEIELKLDELIPNRLFSDFKNLFLENRLSLECVYNVLCCPLSKEPFKHPVAAEDGKTYEHDFIVAYLHKHKNVLPGKKIPQIKPLYENHFVAGLMLKPEVKNILACVAQEKLAHLSTQEKEHLDKLGNYLQARLKEGIYAGSSLGFCEWKKVKKGVFLKQIIKKELPLATLFAKQEKGKLAELKTGRLQKIAKPILDELCKPNKP